MDWEITTIFYAAFWVVRQYCRSKGVKLPRNHGQAVKLLADRFQDIHDPYHALMMLSWNARYRGRSTVDENSKKRALDCYNKILSLTNM